MRTLGHLPSLSLLQVLSGLALAVACGGQDPILERAEAMSSEAPRSGEGGSPGAPPQPARPAQPSPGSGAAPAAVQPPDPPPGTPTQAPPAGERGGAAAPPPSDGPTVTLSGVVEIPDWKGGTIRVDIFDGDQQAAASGAGKRPSVVAVARLEAPGAFQVRVPASGKQVWLGGFADEDGDGRPSPEEPSGWYEGNPVATAGDVGELRLRLAPAPPPPVQEMQ